MTDCLFCRIVAGEIAATRVYEEDDLLVFKDINPQAPTHLLIIPKKHIATLNDVRPEEVRLLGRMHLAAKRLAGEAGYAAAGYRTVFNCNRDAAQSVFHIHMHLLAGRRMTWPPG